MQFQYFQSMDAEFRATKSAVVKNLVDYQRDKLRFKVPKSKRVNPRVFAKQLLAKQLDVDIARRICTNLLASEATKHSDKVFYRNVLHYLK